MSEYEKELSALPEPLKSQILSKGDTDFDDPHFLMYEFWLRFGDGFQKLKVYLDGTIEGFPIGTVIMNNASPFVARLRAIIRKQNVEINSSCTNTFTSGNRLAGWRPIETAPKDGTKVLLYFPYYEQKIWVGGYNINESFSNGKLDRRNEGWNIGMMSIFYKERLPTYWMPIPDGPGV